MGLPSGYREVEYIESNGNQYIDTGFKPNQNSRVVFDFFPVSIGQTHLFGSRSSNSSSDYFLTLCTGGYYRDDYASSKTVTNIAPSDRIIIDKNKNVVSFGSQTYTHSAATFTGAYPIALFASNTGGNISYMTSIRLYSCKIYNDGVLVRDFIPCKNSSDVYGLYDIVNNQFYSSATSTLFTGGLPVVIEAGDIFNYIYTGADQTVTLPAGTYKFEAWGAQGGSYSTYNGGAGGYSVGTWTTTAESTQLYIYVGGQPATVSTQRTVVPGGFNGGGDGFNRYYNYYTYGQGGGGGTDIRIGSDSLYARVIVAGGGGGSASKEAFLTKYGGGESGGSPVAGYAGAQTSGGTQGNRGTFGQGGAAPTTRNNYNYGPGGGGGGWYGGSAYNTANDSPETLRDQNGGGSGYVWTSATASSYPSGCLLNATDYLTDAKTYAGNTSFPAVSGGAETGHAGHGYVRITVIVIANGGANIPVNIGGTWKDSDAIYVNIGGSWKEVEAAYVNVGGAWKELG